MAYVGNKVKIPLGEAGLITDLAPDKAPPNSLLKATNICFFNGALEKAPGTVTWNATPVAAGIVAAHYWNPSLVQAFMVVADANGNLYQGRDRVFGTAINQTIASVLTPNCVFTEGGAEQAGNPKKLFLFTGGATLPYVLTQNDTAFHVIHNPAIDWTASGIYPKFGLVHREQLYAFAGQNAYLSSSQDQESFNNVTTSLTLPVYAGEGGELRGAYVFKGRLFCFKDGGFVYSLNDSDPNQANWYWQKVSSNIGLSSPNGLAEGVNDLMIANTYGTVSSFTGSLNLGNVEAADIVRNAGFERFVREYISQSGLQYSHMRYYALKKMLFLTCRSMYGIKNDSLLMFDFARQSAIRASLWTKGTPQCLALYKDIFQVERPMYGDSSGYLNLMDYKDRTEGAASYTGAFQTQQLDFSFVDGILSSSEKHFDFLAVHYVPASAGNLSCDYFIDGRYIETLTFQMVQYQRPELGTLLLGTDRLAQGNTETVLRKLSGTGRTFSAYFYQAGSNQSFQIPAITVYFRGGGDKATQA